MREFVTFRFVPTMRCNFKCPYCFLPHSNMQEPTMFDIYSVDEWIAGLNNFSEFDIDFYMWGGEPFVIKETYDLVRQLDGLPFINTIRIDTNMSFYDKIIERCPSKKLRLNVSWHTHKYDFSTIQSRVLALHEKGLLCMLNFVASKENLNYLMDEGLDILDIVRYFAAKDIYMNVAADFHLGNDEEYRKFITKFTDEFDWENIHGKYPSYGAHCSAGYDFFTINQDGSLTSCGRQHRKNGNVQAVVVGNLFEGTLERVKKPCQNLNCNSIISYAHREDNKLEKRDHLKEYVRRNIRHRRSTGVYNIGMLPWA